MGVEFANSTWPVDLTVPGCFGAARCLGRAVPRSLKVSFWLPYVPRRSGPILGKRPVAQHSDFTYRDFLITMSELETALGAGVPQGAGGLLLTLTRESPLAATNGVT